MLLLLHKRRSSILLSYLARGNTDVHGWDCEMMKDYEESTAFLGHWGRFQQVVFFVLCASAVPVGINTFHTVFVADTPAHHCLVPMVNLTQDWRNATIPKEVNHWGNAPSFFRVEEWKSVDKLKKGSQFKGRSLSSSLSYSLLDINNMLTEFRPGCIKDAYWSVH